MLHLQGDEDQPPAEAGDTIALGTPIFTPYLEMPHLEDYDLNIVNVQAKQEDRLQFDEGELKKLLDPKIKAFFVVNPATRVPSR